MDEGAGLTKNATRLNSYLPGRKTSGDATSCCERKQENFKAISIYLAATVVPVSYF